MRSKLAFFLALIVAAVLIPSTASADEIFNTSLASPGVYWGTGNVNSGFDVLTATNSDGSSLEMGLSILQRFEGPITPTTNDYPVNTSSGTLASWDFAFSVNSGTDPLSAYGFTITIANDTTHASVSFDPTLLPDNAQEKGGTVVCNGCAMDTSNNGFQNSENLGFSFLSGPLAFDPSAADTYTITLAALATNGTAIDPSVSVNAIAATPEPATLALMVGGLILLGFAVRRGWFARGDVRLHHKATQVV